MKYKHLGNNETRRTREVTFYAESPQEQALLYRMYQRARESTRLSKPHSDVLEILNTHGPMRCTDIGEYLDEGMTTIQQRCRRLLELGLVGREKKCFPDSAGKNQYKFEYYAI